MQIYNKKCLTGLVVSLSYDFMKQFKDLKTLSIGIERRHTIVYGKSRSFERIRTKTHQQCGY